MKKSIGKKIKLLRQERGLSQEQLAEKANISDRFIRVIEDGNRNYSLKVLNQVLQALDLNFYTFFNNREDFKE